MKNIIVYYLSITVPLAALVYGAINKSINNSWFAVLILIYALIYRTITDYFRLRSKNIIDKKDFWKILKPGARAKYFKDLYFQ